MQQTKADRHHRRVFSARMLFTCALLLTISTWAAADDLLPEGTVTIDDGRADLQHLFASYQRLQAEGWLLDIITQSQPEGTAHPLPVVALRTPDSGPAVWIIAGIHGEEQAGPNAIANRVETIAKTGKHHPVVLIPLANPHGYARNWRYLNTPVYSEQVEGHSVGDASHLLIDSERPHRARAAAASSAEADAITRYVVELAREYPPLISIDLHEDDKLEAGYVYSQGALGAAEPRAAAAVRVLRESGVPVQIDGETRFAEPISGGIVGPVIDSSIDELMSAASIVIDGAIAPGPESPIVLVFETPSAMLPLSQRIAAHEAVLDRLLQFYQRSK